MDKKKLREYFDKIIKLQARYLKFKDRTNTFYNPICNILKYLLYIYFYSKLVNVYFSVSTCFLKFF